ncbi:30S ribosomal protein 3-1, chloroplastic-like [Canna indica]|uniref:30S ribosomal protein 3, chloroplastic n=1 Tax=Canna indica TaxID=4628 RepID=A0AAQ3KDB2_9LILI|nr:30S ribosomal protein 3-1, chloroplastic-like [Canna indica]
MQCVSPLTAQPILPFPRNTCLSSPKHLFASSFTTATTISSFSRSISNAAAHSKRLTPSASAAAAEAIDASSDVDRIEDGEQAEEKQKLGVVVKPPEKTRVVLRFIWMEKNIGLALDQVIPGHGTIPLSPYYFWPRKDAWEELKSKIEQKPWISQKRMIILLNQATDIINLWQQSGGNL